MFFLVFTQSQETQKTIFRHSGHVGIPNKRLLRVHQHGHHEVR